VYDFQLPDDRLREADTLSEHEAAYAGKGGIHAQQATGRHMGIAAQSCRCMCLQRSE
jgi:hypothetical protein